MRHTIDFSPLYRSAVGFDRLASLLDTAARSEAAPGWPPYNIERLKSDNEDTPDAYRIEVAVAGFAPEELAIEVKENVLSITGRKLNEADNRVFLHRGLAERNFDRRFQLADHVRVTEAELNNGLLSIWLALEIPEALKPKQIPIKTRESNSMILEAAQ